MVLAWENLQEVLVSLLFIFDAAYLFPGYFAMSPALLPGFSDPWRSPPALLYPATFDCLFSSTVSATVLSGHFLPTGISSLTLFPNIFGGTSLTFWHNLLLSRFRWEPAVTFESCKASRILETQNRPIYLFDSQYSTIFNTS